jgi:tRNA(Arg) A34 adenosine deaminase TadA
LDLAKCVFYFFLFTFAFCLCIIEAMKHPASVTLTLPSWLNDMHSRELLLPDPEQRMRWVIELSRQNVEHGSGGPFAAAVFARETGRLLGAGVNRVEPLNLSPAHAEVMAIAFAEQRLKAYDLNAVGAGSELVTSSQPCLMCLGAVLWSGVTRLTYAATADDVQGILGFDEGPLPRDWPRELNRRGITVAGEFLRAEAVGVLELYRQTAGTVYNSRRGS